MLHLPPLSATLLWDLAGGLWLAGLWYCAPAICGSDRSAVVRAASAGVLGIGIPFGLGICDVLYASTLWIALAVVALLRIRRCGWFERQGTAVAWDMPILICALVAIAWPAAVRPLMDGDSLSYHLPNAASWLVHHGVWTTGTRYWWYPSGSELFASALFAVGGPAIVGLCGLVPALVLGLRLRAIAVANGNQPLLGTAIACALLATSVASAQVVSLQNDLWLAAFALEALVTLRPAMLAVTALVKPYGVALAAAIRLIRRADVTNLPLTLLAFVPLAIWALRDLVLLPRALVPPASIWYAGSAGTSIAAHLPGAFGVLAAAAWTAGPVWAVLMLIATVTIGFARERWMKWAAFAALALFVIVPFGYNNDLPQLANGESLRYALPFVAIGAAALCGLRGRYVVALIPVALFACLVGIAQIWHVYWSDAATHDVCIVVLLAAVAAIALAFVRSAAVRSALGATAFCIGAVWTAGLAGAHPSAYLADRYGVGGVPAGAFDAFRTSTFGSVVAVRFPAGAATLLRPGVDAYDAEPWGACAIARATGGGLLIALPGGAAALACGRVVFKDASSALVVP